MIKKTISFLKKISSQTSARMRTKVKMMKRARHLKTMTMKRMLKKILKMKLMMTLTKVTLSTLVCHLSIDL